MSLPRVTDMTLAERARYERLKESRKAIAPHNIQQLLKTDDGDDEQYIENRGAVRYSGQLGDGGRWILPARKWIS